MRGCASNRHFLKNMFPAIPSSHTEERGIEWLLWVDSVEKVGSWRRARTAVKIDLLEPCIRDDLPPGKRSSNPRIPKKCWKRLFQ